MYGLEPAGEEDTFAARKVEAAAMGVTVATPGLTTARGAEPERARRLACTRRVVESAGWYAPDIEAARAVVVAANVDREGIVVVRARGVRGFTGISATDAKCELGPMFVDRGFGVDLDDPGHGLWVCFSEDTCLAGWTAVEAVRDFTDRKPTDRPFF